MSNWSLNSELDFDNFSWASTKTLMLQVIVLAPCTLISSNIISRQRITLNKYEAIIIHVVKL